MKWVASLDKQGVAVKVSLMVESSAVQMAGKSAALKVVLRVYTMVAG